MNKRITLKKLTNSMMFLVKMSNKNRTISAKDKSLGIGTKYATNEWKILAKFSHKVAYLLHDDVYSPKNLKANLVFTSLGKVVNKDNHIYVKDLDDNTKSKLCYGDIAYIINGLADTIFTNMDLMTKRSVSKPVYAVLDD